MKKEAVGHTKMKRLCRRLDLPTWQAVGLLELLWHITAREAPRGDIGRMSNEDIALALDYRGDEDKLIQSLVQSGWIDLDDTHRLVVHDWYDHADDSVHMKLARTKQYFVRMEIPKLSRLGAQEKIDAHNFYDCAHAVRTNQDIVQNVKTRNDDLCAQNDCLCAPPSHTLPKEILVPAESLASALPSGALAPASDDTTNNQNLEVIQTLSLAHVRTPLEAAPPVLARNGNGNGNRKKNYTAEEFRAYLIEHYGPSPTSAQELEALAKFEHFKGELH